MEPEYGIPNSNFEGAAREPVMTAAPATPARPTKKSMGWMLTAILFILATAGLGVYVAMDLMAGEPECPAYPVVVDSTVSVLNFEGGTAVLYGGEIYAGVMLGGGADWESWYGSDDLWDTLKATQDGYQSYTFGNSTVRAGEYGDLEFMGAKLEAADVVAIHDYAWGQAFGEDYGLLALYEDGTVGYISLVSLIEGGVEVEAIDGLSDVVEFVTENNNGLTTYAVTSSGEKLNLTDYIPE